MSRYFFIQMKKVVQSQEDQVEEGGFLKWFPNVSLENQRLIACSVIIDMMQVENISVDEGTRIRHRELSHSLSEVALMMKSIIILFVIHVLASVGVGVN